MCGSAVTLGWVRRRKPIGSGSVANTSSSAARKLPVSNAWSKAFSCTVAPRLPLMKMALVFIRPNLRTPISPRVSPDRVSTAATMSARCSTLQATCVGPCPPGPALAQSRHAQAIEQCAGHAIRKAIARNNGVDDLCYREAGRLAAAGGVAVEISRFGSPLDDDQPRAALAVKAGNPSALVSPVRKRPSSRPSSAQSARAARSLITSRIPSGMAHSVMRKLKSKDTLQPAARISSMMWRAGGKVVAEIAANTHVAYGCWADSSQALSMLSTYIQHAMLAATLRTWPIPRRVTGSRSLLISGYQLPTAYRPAGRAVRQPSALAALTSAGHGGAHRWRPKQSAKSGSVAHFKCHEDHGHAVGLSAERLQHLGLAAYNLFA